MLAAAAFLASNADAQSSVTTYGEIPPADRSFYYGQPVVHPETISGAWEASDGNGGAVGIHLQLMTEVSGDADPPVWTPQYWQHLDLGVFQRRGAELVLGEENYFTDDPRGGPVTVENGHIQLHFVSSQPKTPSVDLDLARQPDGCWHGRFHRGSFDSAVSLCRPTPGTGVAPSPLVGTWSSDHGRGGCVHVYETGPNTFTGWSDPLQIPGQIIFSRTAPGPHQLYQNYGNLVKVHLADNGEVSLEFGAFNPVCCPHQFIGKLSADGSTLRGDFPPGLNQSSHPAIWTKMSNDVCVDPSALHQQHSLRPPSKN
jgi:hypothetical protein